MEDLILSREQSRMVDEIAITEFGIPGVVLMENAGRNVAELIKSQSPSGLVTILCGKGNNGGDGFVIARHLDNHGHRVMIVLLHDPAELTGDAAINFQIIEKSGLALRQLDMPGDLSELELILEQSEWVVDAILGTGMQGTAREPFLSVIQLVNCSGCKVLAVDVPSGLDANAGPVDGATIIADLTATFVTLKPGLKRPGAEQFTGEIKLIDIGLPRGVLTKVSKAQ